ncbi:hypothetical protein CYANOKiyG1_21400 [Okeania sp. KiyG1]|nr:hypothetical protein CYANOKiyG1_21400 [Okeania sp. KiyG1]
MLYLPIVIVSACLSSIFKSKGTIVGEKSYVNWGYIGESRLENFAELSPEYQICQTVQNQSQINIKSPISIEAPQTSINVKSGSIGIIKVQVISVIS